MGVSGLSKPCFGMSVHQGCVRPAELHTYSLCHLPGLLIVLLTPPAWACGDVHKTAVYILAVIFIYLVASAQLPLISIVLLIVLMTPRPASACGGGHGTAVHQRFITVHCAIYSYC